MATLHKIEISHFRGIVQFSQTFSKGVTCIIGRGDSGKTTILDAIALVLSPSYTVNFYDSDFYQCDVSTPIQIRATLTDLPPQIKAKYWEYVIGVKEGNTIEDFENKDAQDAETAIIVRLTVDKNLEPIWEVYNNRGIEPKTITATDRAKLNMAFISDYSDRQFSMMKGNPLFSIYKQKSDEEENLNTLVEVIRNSKSEIDTKIGEKFQTVIDEIKQSSLKFGINANNLKMEIDPRDIYIKDNKVCLHEGDVPLRLKGKGSKRLISLAIQLSLSEPNSIILIDEVEIGLEPDRVQHLVHTLKNDYPNAQIILTTHSRDVIVELDCTNLYVMRNGNEKLIMVDSSMQGCVRSNPEAFFAERVIVCEGDTEIGFCRALNEWRISNGKKNFAYMGIRLANGGGKSMIDRAKILCELGFDVCLYCDSDEENTNSRKVELSSIDIMIIDCDHGYAFESQLFNDVPWETLKTLIDCRKEDGISDRNIFDAIGTQMELEVTYKEDWLEEENDDIRKAIAKTAGEKTWFKRVEQGEKVGEIVLAQYNNLSETSRLKWIIDKLSGWIDK